MNTCFRGWRRKVGVMTLVLACLFAGALFRSRFYEDHLTVAFTRTRAIQFHSLNGGLSSFWYWQSENDAPRDPADSRVSSKSLFRRDRLFNWGTYPVTSADNAIFAGEWTWSVGKFGFGHWAEGPMGFRVLRIPYWSITLVASLLSAYLLLWTPDAKRRP